VQRRPERAAIMRILEIDQLASSKYGMYPPPRWPNVISRAGPTVCDRHFLRRNYWWRRHECGARQGMCRIYNKKAMM
jgi:hypothetical protein